MTKAKRNQPSPSEPPPEVEYVIHFRPHGEHTQRRPFKTRLEAESEVARLTNNGTPARYIGAFTKDKDGVTQLFREEQP